MQTITVTVFNLLRSRVWGFSPRRGPSPPPYQISPPSVQRWGYRTPKLKVLLRFGQNVEYKRPAGAYPLCDFHKICRVCTAFQMRQLLKFRWICSNGYRVMEVLSWWCRVSAKSSTPRSSETMRQTPKSFQGARTCSRSSITIPSLVGLGFNPPPGPPKTLSFLSVCLFVRHTRQC